jgi:hypothetical protein
VLLSLAKYNERQGNHARSQNFRYEAVWNRDPDYMETVERLWLDGFAGPKNLQTTWENLNKLAGSLHMWSKKTFGSIRSEIKKLERRLVQLRSASTTRTLSYGPPWAHYLGGYQDRQLGGPLGLPGLRYTASEGVEHKDYTGVVLG